jgi:hypothetical protein
VLSLVYLKGKSEREVMDWTSRTRATKSKRFVRMPKLQREPTVEKLVFEKNGDEIQIANILEIVDYH